MDPERSLASILFTDIVGSTQKAAELGDSGWRTLLRRHHAIVRRELARHEGREVATAGDGFLAVFDQPGSAILCACATRDAVRELGLEIRSGIHVGQVEREAENVGGIAVHIGARVAALAGPGEVLVSSTVRELEVGSGFEFEDRGARELKGVPGEWRVYAVKGIPSAPARRARRRVAPAGLGGGLIGGVTAFLILFALVGVYMGFQAKGGDAPSGPDTETAPAPAAMRTSPPAVAGAGREGASPAPSDSEPVATPPTDLADSPPAESRETAAAAADTGAAEPPPPPPSTPTSDRDDVRVEPAGPTDVRETAPEGDRARRAFEAARAEADAARELALQSGAPLRGRAPFQRAEARRGAAAAGAAAGRYGEAARTMEAASRDYRRAAELAGARPPLEDARAAAPLRPPPAQPVEGPPPAPAAPIHAAAPVPAAPVPAEPPREPGAAGDGAALDARRAAEDVMGDIRRAIEAEDVAALRRTWVGLSPGAARNFESWFDTIEGMRVAYEIRSADAAGDRVMAEVEMTYRFRTTGGGEERTERFQRVLTLARQGGRWVVVSGAD